MLVQCWASVADVGLTLKQRWVSIRWSSIQSYNQVTLSTTLYCMLKAYTHASLEPDSIFNLLILTGMPPLSHNYVFFTQLSIIICYAIDVTIVSLPVASRLFGCMNSNFVRCWHTSPGPAIKSLISLGIDV